jgi:hypothetical protein
MGCGATKPADPKHPVLDSIAPGPEITTGSTALSGEPGPVTVAVAVRSPPQLPAPNTLCTMPWVAVNLQRGAVEVREK